MARQTLDRAVKFKRLISELDIPRPYVRGLLETLWDVAHECGNPVIGDEVDIEAAAEWPGAAGEFFSALKCRGWIDETESGEWEIHDYWDHAPEYVRKRRSRELERQSRADELRDSADNGGQRQTIADNGPTPAPTPAPTPSRNKPSGKASSSLGDDAADKTKMVGAVLKFWSEENLKPSVRTITNHRRQAVLARCRQYGWEAVAKVLRYRADSDFLKYQYNEGRGAPIDWVFGPKNFPKILDGNYNDS